MIESQLGNYKTELDGFLDIILAKNHTYFMRCNNFPLLFISSEIVKQVLTLEGNSNQKSAGGLTFQRLLSEADGSGFMIYSNSYLSKKIDAKMFRDFLTTTQRRNNHMLIKSNLIYAHSVNDHPHNNHLKLVSIPLTFFLSYSARHLSA